MKLRNICLIVVAATSATTAYADAIQEFALEEARSEAEIAQSVEISKEKVLTREEEMSESPVQFFPSRTCRNVEQGLKYYGSHSLTGLVLLPEPSEDPNIKAFVKRIDFAPYYDSTMGLYTHKRGYFPIRSLTETDKEIVFYTKAQEWRSAKRRGEKIVLTKLGNDKFKVEINRAADYVISDETGKWISKWVRKYTMDNIESTSYIYKITEESKKAREVVKCIE
ncbi:hypothetical protein [Vibrio sp. 1CM23M]|uniref:hypothetical protein n=1 Tax=Vibrio sp. 1CM23M TaxID=2929164 RepID=UPI0020BEAB81|nr:hypothetical protein [Vibrio sp. 1CM23M]MCK8072454.1 hypothetical protein [Vibrio sp. 1CM23M]